MNDVTIRLGSEISTFSLSAEIEQDQGTSSPGVVSLTVKIELSARDSVRDGAVVVERPHTDAVMKMLGDVLRVSMTLWPRDLVCHDHPGVEAKTRTARETRMANHKVELCARYPCRRYEASIYSPTGFRPGANTDRLLNEVFALLDTAIEKLPGLQLVVPLSAP